MPFSWEGPASAFWFHARVREVEPSRNSFRFSVLTPVNIHFPFEVRTFLNGNALCRNVAGDHRRLSQFDLLAGLDIAFQLALHDHALGFDARFDLAVRTDGQAVAFQSDASLHLAIYIEVFAARQFALNDD